MIDPQSKFVISHVAGKRNETLIHRVLTDTAQRLLDPKKAALFSDGFVSYKTLFPQIFGRSYRPSRQTHLGRPPKIRYRVPRTAAHVQIVKRRQGKNLQSVEIHYAHGSKKRIEQVLQQLDFNIPNTSIIERYNGTARLMDGSQVRRTLAFAKHEDDKRHRGWWSLTVYNWSRSHRSLRQLLDVPVAKKKYEQRSPAMAIGLANHILSQAEILLTPVYPPNGWR